MVLMTMFRTLVLGNVMMGFHISDIHKLISQSNLMVLDCVLQFCGALLNQ